MASEAPAMPTPTPPKTLLGEDPEPPPSPPPSTPPSEEIPEEEPDDE